MILKLEIKSWRIFGLNWDDSSMNHIRDILLLECGVTIIAWNGWNENGYSMVQMILDAENGDNLSDCINKMEGSFDLEEIYEVPDLNITGFKVTP